MSHDRGNLRLNCVAIGPVASRLIGPTLTVGLLFVGLYHGSLQHAGAQETTYTLPKDPEAVILVYDEQSGFGLPRQNPGAVLTILRDGTVQMPDVFGNGRSFKGKLDEQEVQELLRFVIGEQKFFDYDMEQVKAAMKKAESEREIPQIADAPVQVFEVNIADRAHRVSHYALGMARSTPDIEPLPRVWAIKKRLRGVMNQTRVGGRKGVEKLLESANRELKRQLPDIQPFTVEEFAGAYTRNDGVNTATFSRMFKNKDGKPSGQFVVASLEVPEKNGEPKVTIRSKLE